MWDYFYQPLWLTGLPVVLPEQTEAVLLGAAVLGACASQDCSSIQVTDGNQQTMLP